MTFDVSQDSYQSLRAIVAERTDRLLAWVGSGFSTTAGLPNWTILRSKLEGALNNKAESLDPKDSVPLKNVAKTIHSMANNWMAFELLRLHLGDTTWRATIKGALSDVPTTPTPEGYTNIWKLKPHGILDLNLDRLATKACVETMGGGSLIEFNGNQAGQFTHVLRSPRQFICNLHGTVDNVSSWVLTKSQLKSLLEDRAYTTFINSCVSSNTIVFWGMSVDDIAVGSFLEGLTKLGIDFGEHYWVTSRKDLETDNFAERIGVRIIRYNAHRGDHSELSELFKDLQNYVSPEDKEVKQPAFINPRKPEKMELPNSKDILNLDTESIRKILNNRAVQILSNLSLEAYKEYEDFSKEYDEAIYRAWYTSVEPGLNLLGNYKLNSEEAYGAFGKVFQANDSQGKEVAVKVLHQEIRRDPDLLHSFRRGVRSMSILSEHNVEGMVAYHYASEIPAFVVMDWINGPSLKAAVEAKLIDNWGTILRIGADTSSIIRAGHLLPERVLHRDLRPSNIMLKEFFTSPEDWKVVVLDFDLSWYRGSFEKSIIHGSTLMGYLAPEQLRPISGISTRHAGVDSFGLGMTLFFMISSLDPVPNEHLQSGWKERVFDAGTRVPQCAWQSMPNRYSRLILRAAHQNQGERWDMAQIESELQRLLRAVEHPDSVSSAELVAEEIAARSKCMEGYIWDDDRLAAITETPSGIRLCIMANESEQAIQFELSWGRPGVHGRGESVGKWIPARMGNAVDILKKGGWTVKEAEHKWAEIHINGLIKVKTALSSMDRLIAYTEQATDLIRFV